MQPGPKRPDRIPVTSKTLEDAAVIKPTYELPAKNLNRKGNEDKFYHIVVPKEQENNAIDTRKLKKVKNDYKQERGVGSVVYKSNLVKEDMLDIHEQSQDIRVSESFYNKQMRGEDPTPTKRLDVIDENTTEDVPNARNDEDTAELSSIKQDK